MTHPTRPLRSSLLGIAAGTVALVIVTALLSVGIASLRTADRTTTLLVQLKDANHQIDQLRDDYASAQDTAKRLEQQNRHLISQNTRQRAQLDALVKFLRANGLPVPKVPRRTSSTPGPGPPVPKAPATSSAPSPTPHPSTPGSPGSTGTPTPTPSPTTGGIDLDQVCALLHLYPCPLT